MAAISINGTLVFEDGEVHFVLEGKAFTIPPSKVLADIVNYSVTACVKSLDGSSGPPASPPTSAVEALLKNSDAAFRKAQAETQEALRKAEEDYENATANLVRSAGVGQPP